MTSSITGVTALDESYAHQLVAVRSTTAHVDANWQERCYHLLFASDDLMLNIGRAVWAHEGSRRAFLSVSDGKRQRSVRTQQPFAWRDDPDQPDVDGINVMPTRPLEEVRLRYGTLGDAIAVDLTYSARFAPVVTRPLRVEQDGAVVTEYMNFFQSGYYDGWVEVGGARHEILRRAGFRDRGWGVRKHEGAPRRGLVLSAFCELPDAALYLILFEAASGRRVLTDGWWITADGVEVIAAVEHDLRFTDLLLAGGEVRVELSSGQSLRVDVVPRLRLFLASVGYSPMPEFRAPGRNEIDVLDATKIERFRGQTDHGCIFKVDGIVGHGYVETGLGIHAKYRPEPG